jgi:transposase-like protein
MSLFKHYRCNKCKKDFCTNNKGNRECQLKEKKLENKLILLSFVI